MIMAENRNREFPRGYNWQCPLCGEYASVGKMDLANFKCTRCHGLGLKDFSQKAVVVPKIKLPESPLRFRDDRFKGIGQKGIGVTTDQKPLKGTKKKRTYKKKES